MVKIIEIINEEFIAPNECLAVIFADSKEELSSEYSVSGLPTGRALAPGCKFKTADGSEGYLKSDGTIEWVVEPSDLPPVDSSDNGKVLVVEDGQWAVGESPVTPEDIQQAVDNYCEANFSEWAGGLDSGLTQPLMAAPADKVGELKSALSDLDNAASQVLILSPNMVNPTNMQSNKALETANGGHTMIIVDNNGYNTIVGIPVSSGSSYIIGATSRICFVVDENYGILEDYRTDATEPRTINVTHNGFLAISFKKAETVWYVNPSSYGANYYPYGEYLPQTWLINTIKNNSLQNILEGKTLYNFGDSVAAGDGNEVGGVYKGYGKLVAEHNGMTCNDYAHGGATMTVQTGRSCVYNQIVDAPDTLPDFVLIAGGINDLKFTTIGTFDEDYDVLSYTATYINNLDVTKFCGAFERVLYTAINKWTKSQIIYVFEHKMYGHWSDGTRDLHDVAIKICEKWGIPVLDMYVDGGLNLCVISELKAYGSTTTGTGIVIDGVTYDGTHPNGEGYRVYYVPKLTALLKNVCPIYDAP